MKDLEKDLRRALRPGSLPEGLAERIMAGISSREARARSRERRRVILAAAAALVLGVGLLAGFELHRSRERQQVKQELLVGLRLAGSSLRKVRERVLAAPAARVPATDPDDERVQ